MSATIFKHEFRIRVKSVIIWSLSIAALVFFFSSLYSSFADEAALTQQLMSKFPPALLEAFGMTRIDLSTVVGYFSFLFVFVQLCLAIQAANYGVGLVSVEESELTADFLLTKPVSRVKILTSKLLGALSSLLVTEAVIWAVTFISLSIFSGTREYDPAVIILLLVSMLILQLFFLCVGLVISLLVKRVRSVTPYSLGLGFGAYVLAAFSGVFGDVKLEYITPFKHLDPAYIAANGAYNTPLLLLNITITIVALVASYWLYIRRDIKAVS
jgi:ABC-2 type transport system permease protein